MAGEVAAISAALEDVRDNYATIASGIEGPRSAEALQHLIGSIFKELLPLARLVSARDFDYVLMTQLRGPETVAAAKAGESALDAF